MPSDPLPQTSFADQLRAVRPELLPRYLEALPGARAAVLARLWRSLRYERLPGLDGHDLLGPPILGYEVGAPGDGFAVRADGRTHLDPAGLVTALGIEGGAGFAAELDHSVASLALSRAGATPRPGEGLVAYEQSVVDGHPYHPCCRSRPGFTVADQLDHAPEHRPVVRLGLVALPESSCAVVGAWPDSLRDRQGRLLLPAHPWQLREVLPRLGLPGAVDGFAADPLMAVRTLAPLDGGAWLPEHTHVKCSLSLRMTSSVRDISGESVLHSAPLSALLTEVVRRLDDDLLITRNLAGAAALLDRADPPAGGRPGGRSTSADGLSPDLAVLLRDSPEVHLRASGERIVPLAAIAPPAGDPVAWLRELARLAWRPLLRLLAWGVALEAHGQNLLVVLDRRDRPLRLVYRDLADVRVSGVRLAAIGVRPSEFGLGGHVLADDPVVLRRKLFGSLVGGSFGALVSLLGAGARDREAELWAVVGDAAAHAASVLCAEDRRALLTEPLPVKALSRMRLDGQPPGDQWALLPNPLRPAVGSVGTPVDRRNPGR